MRCFHSWEFRRLSIRQVTFYRDPKCRRVAERGRSAKGANRRQMQDGRDRAQASLEVDRAIPLRASCPRLWDRVRDRLAVGAGRRWKAYMAGASGGCVRPSRNGPRYRNPCSGRISDCVRSRGRMPSDLGSYTGWTQCWLGEGEQNICFGRRDASNVGPLCPAFMAGSLLRHRCDRSFAVWASGGGTAAVSRVSLSGQFFPDQW